MILNHEKREDLLTKYKLKRPKTFLVHEKSEAIKKANMIGFPVVAKISSDKHLHRTEIDGVVVNIQNNEELENQFDRLSQIEDIEGVIIQKQVEGVELIVGAKKDDVFGPTIMFGIGGIMVELFEDVSFKIAPIERDQALEMIEEVQGSKLLDGFRGGPFIDRGELADLLVNTSKLAFKEDVEELDFNPVIGNEKGVYICDVKIVV